MTQATVRLPEDGLVPAPRERAREDRTGLSAWVGARIREAATADWPEGLDHLPHHGAGDVVEADDSPPEDRDTLRNRLQERRL